MIAGQSTMIEYPLVPVHPCASVAVTVKLDVPMVVGIPERVPEGESVNPAGKAPAVRANEYGAVPPDAEIVWL